MTLTSALINRFSAAGFDPTDVEKAIALALHEDLRFGEDVTTVACIPAAVAGTARLTSRQEGVVAGLPIAHAVLEMSGEPGTVKWRGMLDDGGIVAPGTILAEVTAPLRTLFVAERTMLNFLTHLSGIATVTAKWVAAVAGTRARIRDTRKTLPGLRAFEKYAVRCGGGVNHRMGLGDAALIKDNHVAAVGGISQAIAAVQNSSPDTLLEVECDTVAQVVEAANAGAKLILLDNMSLEQIREAVKVVSNRSEVKLEASGGLSLANARAIAGTGVDYLAVGALTHSAPALDIGLDLVIGGDRIDQGS